jgi:hypothetical protein
VRYDIHMCFVHNIYIYILGGKGLKKVLIQQQDTEPYKTHRLLDARREY